MSTIDAINPAPTDSIHGEQDLGPLAWVLDEVRKSLDSAAKAMRRFVRDAEVARESDLASLDAGPLRVARQQLHQACGALEMVGMAIPAQMVRSLEAAVQKYVQRPEQCSDEAAAVVERASFALIEFLECVLAGKQVSPVALFPQYRDAQALVGAERVHPADLWPGDARLREPEWVVQAPALPYGPQARARLDSAVLRVVKTADPAAAAVMRDTCLGFVAAQSQPAVRTFWKISAAFFEAVAQRLLPADVYVKRAASRILMQYAAFAKGDETFPHRLTQDLLFFCAQAQSRAGGDVSNPLQAVRAAFGLERYRPVDYETARFGRFDPALLAQARKRIAAATETWSALAGGDRVKLKPAADQFSLVCDSLSKLLPESEHLSKALQRTLDVTVRSGEPPSAALAMEVATAVLYLQATFDDLDATDTSMVERSNRLAQRLEQVLAGAESAPLEPWMEELYRRVSDRQTMGSVVDELRATLAEAEKCLDQFFRDPADLSVLTTVPGQLAQMRGVLSVLGLDQASLAVARMRDTVDRLLINDIPSHERQPIFEKLGNSLGALGFLIDMLGYQRTMARKLFVYDEEHGELRSLMGRTRTAEIPAPSDAATSAVEETPVLVPAPADVAVPVAVQPTPAVVPQPTAAAAAFVPAPPPATEPAPAPAVSVSPPVADTVIAAVPVVAAPATPVVPVSSVPAQATAEQEEDDELLDIFLEEAREVVTNGLAALQVLAKTPGDLSEQTTLRRAFHTLKGSSRMVGLNDFGEAGWAMEQMLNAWLAEQKPMPVPMQSLATEALQGFAQWVEAIAAHAAQAWRPDSFRVAADAMRLRNERLPIVLPGNEGQATAADVPLPDALSAPAAQPQIEVVPELAMAPAPAITQAVEPVPSPLELAPPQMPAPQAVPIVAPAVPQESSSATQEALLPLDVQDFVPTEIGQDLGGSTAAQVPRDGAAIDIVLPDTGDDIDFSVFAAAVAAQEVVAAAPVVPATTEPAQDPAAQALDFEWVLPADAAHQLEPSLLADASECAPELAASAEPALAPILPVLPELTQEPASDLMVQPMEPEPEAEARLAVPEAELESMAPAALSPQAKAPEDPAAENAIDLTASLDGTQPIPAPELVPVPVHAPESALEFALASEAAPPLPDTAQEHTQDTVQEPVLEPEQASPEPELVAALPVEDVKVIGPLKISLPLYNVYLAEADEWSRRLMVCLQDGVQHAERPVSDTAVALAHSLAGSSATVGFTALSGLARALEHALLHVQLQRRVRVEQAQTFLAAGEDILRLLHQFAAGFLKEPQPQLLQALHEILHTEVHSGLGGLEDHLAQEDALYAEPAGEPGLPSPVEPVAASLPTPQPAVPSGAPEDDARVDAAIARAMALEDDLADDIDAFDVVDPDLFQFFEEEAAELFPSLGASLRQWAMQPEDMAARTLVLRALHTLKGSARLAGAMRLGEMAHRFESAVEQIGTEDLTGEQIEPLLANFDSLQASFELLRAVSAPETVPEVAVPVQVLAPVPSAQASVAVVADAPAAPAVAVTAPTPAPLAAVPAVAAVARAPATAPVVSPQRMAGGSLVRVRSQVIDRLVNQAGEVLIARSRLDVRVKQAKVSLDDLSGNLERLRQQLRDIEVQAESQMQSRLALAKDHAAGFDPLEFDRFTRVQELTRMMAESVNDVATVQRNLQRALEGAEDDLIAQGRQARELQRDLLRTRMVEFDSVAERLYAVVRQSSKELGKQVKLDIAGGSIELDRGVLERMTPAFEHLLRNCVSHGIELPQDRVAHGKGPTGTITIELHHEGNDVSVAFRDDGAGLNLERIRAKALTQGLIDADAVLSEDQAAQLIFMPGFSTATEVTGLSGRGIGMDVVRSEVNALGGRIETTTRSGQGSTFRMVLPLTTAVTQVVMLRCGHMSVGIPASLVEMVRRTSLHDLEQAYRSGQFSEGHESVPFYWAGALLQSAPRSMESVGKTRPVMILRSAAQRLALHVDEVLGNQEIVVKNLGPQLSRLPGLAGMSVLASGAVVLVYNPVALAAVYGATIRERGQMLPLALEAPAATSAAAPSQASAPGEPPRAPAAPAAHHVPLVLVVDDSITVRRVTQRLLQREGYRVSLAADGLQALERLQEERPTVVLSDIEMPRMDGFDLARNIRGDAALHDLPIIMITSRIAEKHREHALELGVNHYLGKPYSDEELLGLVQHYAAQEAGLAQPA